MANTGIASRDAPPKLNEEGQLVGYWATRVRLSDKYPHRDPDLLIWEGIHDRLYPVARKILEQKATSVADLAIQAHALSLTYSEVWDDDSDSEEAANVRLLLESICSFTGIDPAPFRAARRRSGVPVAHVPVEPEPADPIFAAIAAFIKAVEAHGRAIDLYGKAQVAFGEEFGTFIPDALNKEVREKFVTINPDFRHCHTSTHEEINRCMEIFPKEVIEAMHEELDHQTAVHDERVKPLEEEQIRSGRASDAALQEMLNTVPTTSEGLLALLRLVKGHRVLAEYFDDEGIQDMIGTIAAAVTELSAASAIKTVASSEVRS